MRSYYYDSFKIIKKLKNKNHINSTNLKKIKKNYNLQFVNFLNKVGYKKNFLKKIMIWSHYLYSKNNKISDEFVYNLKKNVKYNNLNFLLNSIFEKSLMNFKIVCVQINKKYRKKLKKKYTFQLNYLNNDDKKRLFFFKNLYHIISKNSQKNLSFKIYNVLYDMLTNLKKSEIFKLKVLTLKQLAKKK